MALGGVIHRALLAGGASLALLGAAPGAAQEPGVAGAPDADFFEPGARLHEPLPTFADPGDVPQEDRVALRPRFRLPTLAHRAGEGLPLPGRSPGGVPLYGMLAGRALLSALDAGDVLPDAATPWFEGDADRMVAGFEFSF